MEQRRPIIRSLIKAAVALTDAHTEAADAGGPKPVRRPSLTKELAIDIRATNWATAPRPFPGSPTG